MTSSSGLSRNAQRYKVDLAEQMSCCEANYARLLKLMPGYRERNSWGYRIQVGAQSQSIRLEIVERAKYTTMLHIWQEDEPFAWLDAPQMQVRLYHDARMAEVVAWDHHRRLQPRYDYPNRQMYQQDEKAQVNRFLSDWLIHSQANGLVRMGVNS